MDKRTLCGSGKVDWTFEVAGADNFNRASVNQFGPGNIIFCVPYLRESKLYEGFEEIGRGFESLTIASPNQLGVSNLDVDLRPRRKDNSTLERSKLLICIISFERNRDLDMITLAFTIEATLRS